MFLRIHIVRSLSQLVSARRAHLPSQGMRDLRWRRMMLGAAVLCGTLAVGTTAIAAPGTTERVSVASDGAQANGSSNVPAISADGRHVAFRSNASNLVAGD